MENLITKHQGLKTFLLSVATIVSLSGCGTLVTGQAWLESNELKPSSDKVVIVGEVRSEPVGYYANHFALMALFSKIVYRKDVPQDVRNKVGCGYISGSLPVPDIGMPKGKDGSGWSRWVGTPDVKACLNENGLSFETYVHKSNNGTLDEAVIAFRGTENYSTQEKLSDWAANLSAVFGIEPPEYILAQQHVPKIVDALKRNYKNIKIYATGHSLGGGLAQQAGYLSDQIEAVYVFDPSPVTNWSYLKIRGAIKNEDPKIYRIYHWHEGLAYVRNVTSRFNSRRLGRSDFEFYFQAVSPVAAHEMGILACHLARRIQGDSADHGYPKEFALMVTSKEYQANYLEHPVCPKEVVLDEGSEV